MNVPGNAQHSKMAFSMLFMLAWRNLWRHRRRTLITLSSIAFGFGLAVLFIGIGDGSHNSMIRNAIKMGEGHLTVQPSGYIESPANYKFIDNGHELMERLEQMGIHGSVEPRIALQVLASTANNSVGAALQGFDTTRDQRNSMIRPNLVQGAWITADDPRGIVIGAGMAGKLKAKIGSKVVLMAGKRGGDSEAQLGRVRGIFDSSIEEMDDYLVLSNLHFARYFLVAEGASEDVGPVTRFALFLDDPESMEQWKGVIASSVASREVVVLDWQEMMPQLVQFIVVDDAGNYVFLLLILMMVVFGIVNTVLMSVLERTREFGLLRALGISRRHLLTLVFCESLLMSLLAIGLGWLVGGSIHLWGSIYGIDFSSMMEEGTQIMGTFMDPVVYTELSWNRVIQLTAAIFSATLASGIYPAVKASRILPVEALRT